MARGLRAGEPRLRRRGRRRARPRARVGGLLPRLPPLPRAARGARAAAGRAPDALRPHPVGRARLLAGAAGRTCAARCTRGCSRTTSSASTPTAGGGASSTAASSSSAPTASATAAVVRHRGRETRIVTHPISIDVNEFDELRDDPAVLAEEAQIAARRPELLDRPRRPHRPVEEHRPRLPRVRAAARAPPRAARPGRDARAPRPVAAEPARVRGVPRGDRARGRRRQRAVRDGGVAAGRAPDRRQLPAGRRGVQAVRRRCS